MSSPNLFPVQIGRIAATIPVTDIERSVAFYRQFFGLEVVFTNGSPVGFVILRRGTAELHLSLVRLHLSLVRDHRAAAHNVAHPLVGDAGSLYRTMDAAGVRMVKGLRDADYGLRGFVFSDPDGNRVDVGSPTAQGDRPSTM